MTPLAEAGAAAVVAAATPVIAAVEAAALTAATVATNIVAAASAGTNALAQGLPAEPAPTAEEETGGKGEEAGSKTPGENDLA